MRLLDTTTLQLEDFSESDVPPYAILSHTWGTDEVTFDHLKQPSVESHGGYSKILNACQVACDNGYAFIWIDTCCIDKESSSELSEAIASMFTWYSKADVCYAYLVDVDESPDVTIVARLAAEDERFRDYPGNPLLDSQSRDELWGDRELKDQFSNSRWFTRGWTLQELLAPREVIFYSRSWDPITTRTDARDLISLTTGIDARYLDRGTPIETASVAKRMFWASRRCTTRTEDRAYCLLGIFGVNMPLVYGEGENAFFRLQEEILKHHDDQTLFAWTDPKSPADALHGLLAPHPRCFQDSRDYMPLKTQSRIVPYVMTNKGLQISMLLDHANENKGCIPSGFTCVGGPSYTNLTSVYLKKLHDSLPQYSRVKCGKLDDLPATIWSRSLRGSRRFETVFVSRGELPTTSLKLWLRSFFVLREGPNRSLGSYTLDRIVSIKGGEIEEGVWKPYALRAPGILKNAPDYIPSIDRTTEEQARSWVPGQFPFMFEIQTKSDLVTVALEFHDCRKNRIVVMIGTNSAHSSGLDSGVGFDAYIPEPGNDFRLEGIAKFYKPKSLNSLVRKGAYTISIANFSARAALEARVLELDISIEHDDGNALAD